MQQVKRVIDPKPHYRHVQKYYKLPDCTYTSVLFHVENALTVKFDVPNTVRIFYVQDSQIIPFEFPWYSEFVNGYEQTINFTYDHFMKIAKTDDGWYFLNHQDYHFGWLGDDKLKAARLMKEWGITKNLLISEFIP